MLHLNRSEALVSRFAAKILIKTLWTVSMKLSKASGHTTSCLTGRTPYARETSLSRNPNTPSCCNLKSWSNSSARSVQSNTVFSCLIGDSSHFEMSTADKVQKVTRTASGHEKKKGRGQKSNTISFPSRKPIF